MAERVRVELSETALDASPSLPATTICTVYNRSLIVDEYRLLIEGVDATWVPAPLATKQVFPDGHESVPIVFTLPPSAPAGQHRFTVIANSLDNPALSASAAGVLTVGAIVDVALGPITPSVAIGEIEGSFAVRVANSGNTRITLDLQATDEADRLASTFDESRPELAAGEERTVRLTVKPRDSQLDIGAVYQLTVAARIVGAASASAFAEPPVKTATAAFSRAPVVQAQPRLEPQSVLLNGQTAETRVLLTNRAAVPITMALEANDKAHVMSFAFDGGPWREVPPGQTITVPLRIVCLDQHRLAPPPAGTPFVVIVTPIDPEGEARTVQGELALPLPPDVRRRRAASPATAVRAAGWPAAFPLQWWSWCCLLVMVLLLFVARFSAFATGVVEAAAWGWLALLPAIGGFFERSWRWLVACAALGFAGPVGLWLLTILGDGTWSTDVVASGPARLLAGSRVLSGWWWIVVCLASLAISSSTGIMVRKGISWLIARVNRDDSPLAPHAQESP
jgi:hypothetical protein